MRVQRYQSLSDLPERLAIFPLPGALLLPRWELPLNIFEPRYLEMVDFAMSGDRLIGMIQLLGVSEEGAHLAGTGCAGRITSYSETADGRFEIVLSGICRFHPFHECDVDTAFRQVIPDFSDYVDDLQPITDKDFPPREALIDALGAYVKANGMHADWDMIRNADSETLVNALSCGGPFSPIEKQALLEARTLKARAKTLMALLDMDIPGGDTGRVQ